MLEEIKSKSLTPVALGLGGWSGTRGELLETLNNQQLPMLVRDIYKSTASGAYDEALFREGLSYRKNKKAVGADFGEILSPIILTRDNTNAVISFPSSASQKLYDFNIDGISYSAKLGKGATTSINQEELIASIRKQKPNKYRDAFLAIAKMSIKSGRIGAHRILDIPGYKFRSEVDVQDSLKNLSLSGYKSRFPEYAKRAAECRSNLPELYSDPKIRQNFIYWPLGKMLDEAFQGEGNRLVTKAAKQIPGHYAHLDIKNMKVKIVSFSEKEYELVHHQGLKVSARNRGAFK